MGKFTKGQPKTGGRTPGTPNKSTRAIREAFQQILGDSIDDFKADLSQIAPAQRLGLILDMAEYCLPKLQRTETIIESSVTGEQLRELQNELIQTIRGKK